MGPITRLASQAKGFESCEQVEVDKLTCTELAT